MIYSHKKVVNQGPYGSTDRFIDTEDSGSVVLGEYEDRVYLFIPDEALLLDQPSTIEFRQEVDISQEVKDNLRTQKLAEFKKKNLRSKIEVEVGDIHDLIADAMKLIEFNFMLTSRLAADYLGTEVMSDEEKATYAQRNQRVLDSIQSGQLLIRGSFEAPDEMMDKVLSRYSKIQELVKNNYSDEQKRLGL